MTISLCTTTADVSRGTHVTCVPQTTSSWTYGGQNSATITFLTTDKNPAVVYRTIDTPNYGVISTAKPGKQPANTNNNNNGAIPTPVYDSEVQPTKVAVTTKASTGRGGNFQQTTQKPITVIIQPTAVIIDGNTIKDTPGKTATTQVVVISSQTFTIGPTQIVGGGATITRPSAPMITPGAGTGAGGGGNAGNGGIFVVPKGTSTDLAGVPVVVTSTMAVIGGTAFDIGPGRSAPTTTAIVNGKTFSIGPSGIAVIGGNGGGGGGGGSETLTFNPVAGVGPGPGGVMAQPTEVVVAGGELITAIGQSVVVVHGTTITYGPSASGANDDGESTLVVAGETLTLGPGGITAQDGDRILGGGPRAKPTETQFAIVGGATITQIGASVVVVEGHAGTTYTVGPASLGGLTTTTEIVVNGGSQTVTIGPEGVTVATMTFPYPFGPTTTTIIPGATIGPGGASETGTSGAGLGDDGWGGDGSGGGGGGGEEDGAASAARMASVFAVLVAVGGVVLAPGILF